MGKLRLELEIEVFALLLQGYAFQANACSTVEALG
jgi:hypothetical protein